MSTTIYSGYKLKTMNVLQLDAFFKDFTKKAENLAGILLSAYLAKEIIAMIDSFPFLNEETFIRQHVLFEKESTKLREQEEYTEMGAVLAEGEKVSLSLSNYAYRYPLSLAFRKTEERYREIQRTMHRDPEIDFDVTVSLLPIQMKRGMKILAYFSSEMNEFENLFNTCNEVSFYGYWNNQERPDNLTSKQWKQRKKDWDTAIPGYSAESPLEVNVIKGFPSLALISAEELLKHIPSLTKRAKSLASKRVMAKKFRALRILYSEDNMDTLDIYHEARRWIRTVEGIKAVKKEADRLSHLLIPKITKEHIMTKFSELSKVYEQIRKRYKGRSVARRLRAGQINPAKRGIFRKNQFKH
jgi:hypothetical protein